MRQRDVLLASARLRSTSPAKPRLARCWSSAPQTARYEDEPHHGSISNCAREDSRIAFPAIVRIELLIVAHVEDHRGRANQRRVGETGADCSHATLERAKNITTARVAADLTIVVSDDANQQTRRKFESSSPLKMKFVATLIVGSRIFDIERDARSSIELQLLCAVSPCEGPARINSGPIETSDWRKATLPMARWGDSLHIDKVREVAVLPSN